MKRSNPKIGVVALVTTLLVFGCHNKLGVNRFHVDADTGLKIELVLANSLAKPDEPLEISFVVTNESANEINYPVPNNATLSFNAAVEDKTTDSYTPNGHLALAANPSSRDRWTQLSPRQSLSYTFSYQWPKPGIDNVYLIYSSRFEDKPFPKLRTPTVAITVK